MLTRQKTRLSSISKARMSGLGIITAAALAASAILGGCGPTFTPEEAQEECDRLREDIDTCFTDEVYQACLVCHEDCGRECTFGNQCSFICD